jgi:hypothetical protein
MAYVFSKGIIVVTKGVHFLAGMVIVENADAEDVELGNFTKSLAHKIT